MDRTMFGRTIFAAVSIAALAFTAHPVHAQLVATDPSSNSVLIDLGAIDGGAPTVSSRGSTGVGTGILGTMPANAGGQLMLPPQSAPTSRLMGPDGRSLREAALPTDESRAPRDEPAPRLNRPAAQPKSLAPKAKAEPKAPPARTAAVAPPARQETMRVEPARPALPPVALPTVPAPAAPAPTTPAAPAAKADGGPTPLDTPTPPPASAGPTPTPDIGPMQLVGPGTAPAAPERQASVAPQATQPAPKAETKAAPQPKAPPAAKGPTPPPSVSAAPSNDVINAPPATKAVPAQQQQAALPPATKSVPGAPKGATPQSMEILFAAGQSDLTDAIKGSLDKLADGLKGDEKSRLQLLAYASEDSPSKARRLSLSRALAVRSHLIAKGIRSTRIDVRALGDQIPSGEPNRVDVQISDR